MQEPHGEIGEGEAIELVDVFCEPNQLLSTRNSRSEVSQLGKARDDEHVGKHGRGTGHAEVFTDKITLERLDIPHEQLDRLPVVAAEVVCEAKTEGRRDAESD